jgi:hypothetical protein
MSAVTEDNGDNQRLVNDSNRTLAHTPIRATSGAHMPGDETWGMFEIALFLASAICIFVAAALAVTG